MIVCRLHGVTSISGELEGSGSLGVSKPHVKAVSNFSRLFKLKSGIVAYTRGPVTGKFFFVFGYTQCPIL